MRQTSMFMGMTQSSEQAQAWQVPTELPELTNIDVLSCDTETNGRDPFKNKPVGISIAYRTDKLNKLYVPFGHAQGNIDPDKAKQWARTELAFHRIVFANAKFDCHMFHNIGIDLEEIGVEPMDIAFGAALLDDNRRAGLDLDTLGLQYAGDSKLEFQGDKNRMAEYPSWLVGPYAEQDASLTLRVYEATKPLIDAENLNAVHDLESDLIYAVCEIERNGSRIDVPKLDRWRREVRKEYERCLMLLYQMTGLRVETGSGESLKRMFKELGVKPPKVSTKTGKSSFTEKQLTAMKHPASDLIVRIRRLEGLLTRYLDKFWEGLDGDLLRSQYHQLKSSEEDHGTISGRFSSSGSPTSPGYKFNAQQVIKTKKQIEELGENYLIRELFIPEEGQQFFGCDAKQIEYRLFVHFSQAKSGLEAYRKDPNTQYHKLVHELVKAAGSAIDYDQCKNTNFARLYGAGVEKIAKMIDLSVEETKAFLQVYDQVLPEAKPYMRKTSSEAEAAGFVATVLGRRARFGKGESTHKAVNRIIQGTAADLFKLKLLHLYRNRKTLGITTLRQAVHDEQCGDKDPDPKYTKLIQECFDEQEVKLSVPILWDLRVGNNWKECK